MAVSAVLWDFDGIDLPEEPKQFIAIYLLYIKDLELTFLLSNFDYITTKRAL